MKENEKGNRRKAIEVSFIMKVEIEMTRKNGQKSKMGKTIRNPILNKVLKISTVY